MYASPFTLTVCTFYCKHVKRFMNEICERCDMLFLQEIWLCKKELDMLCTIHCDFYAGGVSSMDDCERIRVGRPYIYGGLGILWRKSLGQSCIAN